MSVLLSAMITEQNNFQTLESLGETNKVRFIDKALTEETTWYKLPHRRRKTSMRVFAEVYYYPKPSDYKELCAFDNDAANYDDKPRMVLRSFNDFLEKSSGRNEWCEVFDNAEVQLGINYKLKTAANRQINNAQDSDDYTPSGDATAVADDKVFFKEGNGSVKVTVVNSTGSAVIEYEFDTFTDLLYKRKYKFAWVYLDSAPTAITMRFGKSSSHYLYKVLTTQFAGQAFEADAWNLIAFDLNDCDSIGTIDGTDWAYGAIILTGAATGTYYIDASSMRQWELADLWYYSENNVQNDDGTFQPLFYDPDTEEYETDSELIGPQEWANYINTKAMILGAIDKNDGKLLAELKILFADANEKLKMRFPVIKPLITNFNWRFNNDPLRGYR